MSLEVLVTHEGVEHMLGSYRGRRSHQVVPGDRRGCGRRLNVGCILEKDASSGHDLGRNCPNPRRDHGNAGGVRPRLRPHTPGSVVFGSFHGTCATDRRLLSLRSPSKYSAHHRLDFDARTSRMRRRRTQRPEIASEEPRSGL